MAILGDLRLALGVRLVFLTSHVRNETTAPKMTFLLETADPYEPWLFDAVGLGHRLPRETSFGFDLSS